MPGKTRPARAPVLTDPIRPGYYRRGVIEVWDFIEDQNLSFLAGNVVKYTCRYREKNGVEDLRKARAYLDKLISVVEADAEPKGE